MARSATFSRLALVALAIALLSAQAHAATATGGRRAGQSPPPMAKPPVNTTATAAAAAAKAGRGTIHSFVGAKVLATVGNAMAGRLRSLWGSVLVDRPTAEMMAQSLGVVGSGYRAQLASLQADLDLAEGQAASLKSQVATLKRQLGECKGAGLLRQLNQCKAQLAASQSEVAELQSQAEELLGQVDDLTEQLEECSGSTSTTADDSSSDSGSDSSDSDSSDSSSSEGSDDGGLDDLLDTLNQKRPGL